MKQSLRPHIRLSNITSSLNRNQRISKNTTPHLRGFLFQDNTAGPISEETFSPGSVHVPRCLWFSSLAPKANPKGVMIYSPGTPVTLSTAPARIPGPSKKTLNGIKIYSPSTPVILSTAPARIPSPNERSNNPKKPTSNDPRNQKNKVWSMPKKQKT